MATVTTRLRDAWAGFDGGQRRGVLGMAATIVALHIPGCGPLLLLVVPDRHLVDGAIFGTGLGVTAYSLGMRYAVDADHIAAIENTARKLLADKQKPLAVGFWFSLGHSTIVLVLASGESRWSATLSEEPT